MKSYDNDMFEESTGIYTVEITLQQREYVGHVTQIVSSDCKGLELLDFNFECEDGNLRNDCNLKYDEDRKYFSATLKDPEGNTLDVEGYAEEFNNMIVKMEIVDYRREQVW